MYVQQYLPGMAGSVVIPRQLIELAASRFLFHISPGNYYIIIFSAALSTDSVMSLIIIMMLLVILHCGQDPRDYNAAGRSGLDYAFRRVVVNLGKLTGLLTCLRH